MYGDNLTALANQKETHFNNGRKGDENTQKEQKKTQTEDSTDPLLALFVLNQCQKNSGLQEQKKEVASARDIRN